MVTSVVGTRRIVVLAIVVLACIGAFAAWSGYPPEDHELLREVYTPTFARIPEPASIADTIAALRHELTSPAGQDVVARLIPGQAGALWVAAIVAIAVGFEFHRLRSARNLDLLLMLLLGAALFDIMRRFRAGLDPLSVRLLDLVFIAVTALNLALLVRALWHARRADPAPPWRPNIGRGAIKALALLLLAGNVVAALQRQPDDAGFFVNLGAQRLRERGRMPYGDPLLTGTPGAAYGPMLYALHVPFQFAIAPHSPNRIAMAQPPLGAASTYVLPPPLATKLCTVALHLAGVLALFLIGARLTRDVDVGWGLVALYCGSAFILGVGGDTEFIGGMTFVSHIGPAAATLVAFACLPIPALAGALLAVSTGVGLYPAFIFPAWAGYFLRDRAQLVRFVGGFALAAAVIGGGTWALSQPAAGRSRIATILADTLGHHTDPDGYGRSPYGFWGQRQGIRRWMITPLVGRSGLTTPGYVVFLTLVTLTFVMARGASVPQLALLTAVVAIAASVVKIHATGVYVAWAYPFLLIGIFASRPAVPVPAVSAEHGG